MNRKEFQEWLDQFPEDTKIEVVVVEEGRAWGGDTNKVVEFDAVEFDHFEFTDFTENKFIGPDHPLKNTKTLVLGEPR